MRLVSYNVQFGLGKDGRFDIARLAAEIGTGADGPDLIALQEVVRHAPPLGVDDQAAEFAAAFPEHDWVYGPSLDVSSAAVFGGDAFPGGGRGLRTQFGNMLLSRWPILSSRNYMLPKRDLPGTVSLQRAALEGVIAAPTGPIRVYDLHLAHASAAERGAQIDALLGIVAAAPPAGGVWTGKTDHIVWAPDLPTPPMPEPAAILGDFNMTPEDDDYRRMCASFTDAWTATGHGASEGRTCGEDRIDFVFLSPDLADRLEAAEIDAGTIGSDHQPVRVTLRD